MKKWFATWVTASLLAMNAAAATPPAPQFQTPIKIAEGNASTYNMSAAINGTTLVTAFTSHDAVRAVQSSNAGATWDASVAVDYADPTTGVSDIKVAIGPDPLAPGKSAIHAVWTRGNGHYYAYRSDTLPPPSWTTPVPINGSVLDNSWANITVTPSGGVHVVFGGYYTTRLTNGTFSEPVAFPGMTGNTVSTINRDASGNVYWTVIIDNYKLWLSKLPAGTSSWSIPTLVYQSTAEGNLSRRHGFAAADAQNLYVGINDDAELALMVSSNGGQSWAKRTLLTGWAQASSWGHPAVVVTSAKVLTYVCDYSTDGVTFETRVWRTNNGGTSWSPYASVAGQQYPGVALDSAGKAQIIVGDKGAPNGDPLYNLILLKEK